MSLPDFFQINLPYGIKKTLSNEWFAFNREYMPLGFNSVKHKKSIFEDDSYGDLPIFTKYKGLTELQLSKIIDSPKLANRDEEGKIIMIYLYTDKTNPNSHSKYWESYFHKIRFLSKFSVNPKLNKL